MSVRETIERVLRDADKRTGVDDSVAKGLYGVGAGAAVGALIKNRRFMKKALQNTQKGVLDKGRTMTIRQIRNQTRDSRRLLAGSAAATGSGLVLQNTRDRR